jgi:hypothetical protein
MKITEQFVIAWIRNEGASADELVAVHSRPISSSDADEHGGNSKMEKLSKALSRLCSWISN